jgi:hypothetical protein
MARPQVHRRVEVAKQGDGPTADLSIRFTVQFSGQTFFAFLFSLLLRPRLFKVLYFLIALTARRIICLLGNRYIYLI